MLASAWLFKATRNDSYLRQACAAWTAIGRWSASPYNGWAATTSAAAVLMLG